MCKEDKIIINHVNGIKEKVNLLTGGYSDEETLDNIITMCKSAKQKLESSTFGYFVAVVEDEMDYDTAMCNKYYIPIGKDSKKHAKKLAKKYHKKLQGCYYDLIEVSQKVYYVYESIAKLDILLDHLPEMFYSSQGRDYVLEDSIRKEQDNLRKKIGRIKTYEYIIDESQV